MPNCLGERSKSMLRIAQTQGTVVTLRLLPGRPLPDQHERKTLCRGRDYRVSPGAILVVDVPRVHMVHVQMDRYLYLVSLVERVLTPVGQLVEGHTSAEKRRAAGTAVEVSLGEEGTWSS